MFERQLEVPPSPFPPPGLERPHRAWGHQELLMSVRMELSEDIGISREI